MKKTIKRFWGVGLILIIMSSLLVVPAPVSGSNYAWGSEAGVPNSTTNLILGPSAGPTGSETIWDGVYDVAQTADGAKIYAVGYNTTNTTSYLYVSTNGGSTWTKCNGTFLPSGVAWDYVAVAPDDGNVVAVGVSSTNSTYFSTTGGSVFSDLSYGGDSFNDLQISQQSGPYRYVAVAEDDALYVWNYGATVPSWTNILGGTGGWTAFGSTPVDVEAMAFSTSFASDQAILFVTETATAINLNVASFNTKTFNSAVDTTFPRALETGSGLSSTKADISLDPNFYLGDEATQIGFVAASISDGSAIGGVYRISTYTYSGGVYTLTQILTDSDMGSVSWDGTNLVTAPYVAGQPTATATTIYRSSNALASSGVSFLPSSTAKTPTTGYKAQVVWNGGNVLCMSRGTNGGVAKSTDLGKSFNGIALLNTKWSAVEDIWVSPDGSVVYLVTGDLTDLNVWRKMSGSWQRIMIMPGATGADWLVRGAASDPTAVVLALQQGQNMYISTDSGEYKWTARSSSYTIQDFVVESKDVIYVGRYNNGGVIKSTNGAFTWGSSKEALIGDTCYSLTLLSAGNLLVGGATGYVAYSTDSGSSFTMISSAGGGGNTLVAATGLSSGDTIIAGGSSSTAVKKWIIGDSVAWVTGQTVGSVNGLVMASGVLYVNSTTDNATYRFLTPTIPASSMSATDTISDTTINTFTTHVNGLQASTGSTKLWAITTSGIKSYTEYLATAADAVALSFPTDGYMLQVNSLSGNPNNFVFQWSSPPAISTTQAYGYDIYVYLDSTGKVSVGNGSVSSTPAGTVSIASGTVFTPIPGTTYYWRVRVSANSPVRSAWSEMRTLTVQPLAASVPAISSPANGATIKNQSPAFSWSPVTSCTKYEFQLSTTPTFGTTVLTDTPASAGTLVPVTIKLEKGKQYFWRVRALEPVQGDWSTVGNFIVAVDEPAPPSPTPPVTITQVPAPTFTIPPAQAAPTYTLTTPETKEIAPTYIWAIIIIGAILVIAVIVLIVRTRRSV
jgi:hypothetical protein